MTPNLLDELEKIVALSEKATPGKVELHTSCSWRRIVAERGRPFLVPGIDPDRHPNMDTPESAEFVVALVNWFRTHATALADMAKRMEAVERDASKCWALHFKGPDDVVAAPSREAAETVARNFNAYWEAHKHERDHDIRVVAEVIEWEHGAVEHAKSAAEHWPEYADLLNAAIDATQEGEG